MSEMNVKIRGDHKLRHSDVRGIEELAVPVSRTGSDFTDLFSG